MPDASHVPLYGKRGCPAAYAIRDFLQRSDIPFEWLELRDDAQARTELGRSIKRLTSAVGEGAMTIAFVHRYLAGG